MYDLSKMQDQIQQNLKNAQLSKDELQVSVLRMLISELKYAEINKGDQLTDDEVKAVVQKEVKKRRDSIEAFTKGGRMEMAAKEKAEAEILANYLPQQMSDEELTQLVKATITELGASNMADMGKVIGQVVANAQGQADSSRVSTIVREELLK